MLGDDVWRDQKPDAQAFDAVRITTVPRYKTSGLSGNEWRISAKIEFLRKGRVVHEEACRNVESACRLLPWYHAKACDNGKGFFAGEGDICDQEGCAEPATVTLKKKQDICRSCGNASPHTEYTDRVTKIRKFCARHSTRGDCGLDDADRNYEPMTGEQSAPQTGDESPSAFGGFVKVDP